MRLVPPQPVTDAVLVNSSVPEADYPAWQAVMTYALAARVIAGHRIWESAVADNIGHAPGSGPQWIDVGPVNRWAMFDPATGPRTTAAAPIAVALAPAAPADTLGLLDLDAASVRVQVTAGGVPLLDTTREAPGSILTVDLPPAAGATIIVTIAPLAGTAAVGKLVIGRSVDLGDTEDGPTISLTDYSRRETDDFGVTTVVERAWSREIGLRTRIASDAVDAVRSAVATVRSAPALWIGDDGFQALTGYGFIRDFNADVSLGSTTFCTWQVEGLPASTVALPPVVDPAPGGASDFRVLRPVAITPAMLRASNADADAYPAWPAGAPYVVGARVTRGQRVYEAAAGLDGGVDPASGDARWIDIGPVNRWAAFDQALGTATVGTGTLTMTIAPGERIGAVAALNVEGVTVRVQAPGYDRTAPVTREALLFALDLAPSAEVTVTITGADAAARVAIGTLLVGTAEGLGIAGDSPRVSIADYSRRDTDDFGNTTIVPRGWAKRMSATGLIRSDAIEGLVRRVASLRATPALWIAQGTIDSLCVYGFFKDWRATVGANVSTCEMTIEGLTEAMPAPAPLPGPDWTSIVDSDPAHPKPEDGATVGAPAGTNVGTTPAAQVEQVVNRLATFDPAPINAAIGQAQDGVAQARADIAAEVTRAKADTAAIRDVQAAMQQSISGNAAGIETERTVRASADSALSQRVDTVVATAGGVGLTPNGDFRAGAAGWTTAVGAVDFVAVGTGTVARVATGAYAWLIRDRGLQIDPNRAYKVTTRFKVSGASCICYFGIRECDRNGAVLGNNYNDGGRAYAPGTYTSTHVITGTGTHAAPFYGTVPTFHASTWSIWPMFLANYPDSGGPFAGAGVDILELWIEDVTAANAVDARVTNEVAALAAADQSIASRTSAVESRFARTPVSLIAIARGYGAQSAHPSAAGGAAGLLDAAGTRLVTGARSYTVIRLRADNVVAAAQAFDVYGDPAAAAAMAAYLNATPAGTGIVVVTEDEPANMRLNGGLPAAMQRCGAGAAFDSAAFVARSAYILIGQAGIGAGNGLEYFRSAAPNEADAYIEARFDVLNGRPVLAPGGATVTSTAARIATEETTRAAADSALAGRTSVLESNLTQAAVITVNANFAIWDDARNMPAQWGEWSAPYSRTRRQPGIEGQNAYAEVVQAGGNAGLFQDRPGSNGWYVISATVQLGDGDLNGAGLLLYALDDQGGYLGQATLSFAEEPDATDGDSLAPSYNQLANGTYTSRVLRYSKLVRLDAVNTQTLRLYAMTCWSGFGRGSPYKNLVWHKCSVRAATAAEIKGQKAYSDAQTALARIATEETTRANADSALASRVSTVETRADGLGARVTVAEAAVSNLNGRTAAYLAVEAVAGNNRAQLSVHADANGGAGVDIVGDVAITGASGGNRAVVSGAGLQVFYDNGVAAVELGLFG